MWQAQAWRGSGQGCGGRDSFAFVGLPVGQTFLSVIGRSPECLVMIFWSMVGFRFCLSGKWQAGMSVLLHADDFIFVRDGFFEFGDDRFLGGDQRIEHWHFFCVSPLLVLAEKIDVRLVRRTPLVEEQFVLFEDCLAQLLCLLELRGLG